MEILVPAVWVTASPRVIRASAISRPIYPAPMMTALADVIPVNVFIRAKVSPIGCGRCRGHNRVQQPQNCREQLFHELTRVNSNSSADTWLGTPGSPPAQVVHAGEDLALMLGWQRNRGVPDLAVLPHGGLDGLPVHGVPQSAQNRQHVRQRSAAGEEISQGLALAGEPGSPASLLPAGVTLITLNREQDVDEAGGGIDRSHEHDQDGVRVHQDGPDGISLPRQVVCPVEAVPGPERSNDPHQQRPGQAGQRIRCSLLGRGGLRAGPPP